MSQSSQESLNLLSPPPTPVAITRTPRGLLAIKGESNNASDIDGAIANNAKNVCRLSHTRESDAFDESLNQRVSIEAQFTSARRRRPESTESEVDNVRRGYEAAKPSAAGAKESSVPSWRKYTKSYKTPTYDVQVSHKKSNGESSTKRQSAKRPPDDFRETYLPFAKSRRSRENVDVTSDNIEYAKLIMREIEVPEQQEGDMYYASQLTMTQAVVGGDVDEEYSDDDEGENRLEGVEQKDGEEEDVFEYRSLNEGISKGCVEEHVKSQELENENLASGEPVCKLSDDKVSNEEKLENIIDDEGREQSKDLASDVDQFEFEPNQDKAKVKQLPSAVAAAAKKRKKGPTDKALLEESNYDSSQKSSQNSNLLENQKQSSSVNDFNNGAPDFKPIAEADAEARQQNDDSFTSEKPKQTKHETSITNYNQIENMYKALNCPICCHSLKSSTFLPCGHAFCHDCLSKALRNSGSNASCPICRLKFNRRSGSRNQQLDDIVDGFKSVMRAFGFAPLTHSNNVGMTQLSPGKDCLEGDEENSGRRAEWGMKKRKIGMDEALEHHQVAQSNLEAFSSYQRQHAPLAPTAAQKSSGNRMTKEELERLNMTRRFQLLAADQAAVMQADQEALKKVSKKKMMVADATKEFATIDKENKEVIKPRDKCHVAGGKKGEVGTDRKLPPAATREESQDTFFTASKSNNVADGKKEKGSAADASSLSPIESQDTFHTAKSAYSKEVNRPLQPNRSSIETTQSPTVLHDGNTAKKERPVDSEKEIFDNRQSLATAASTIVLHDGNTTLKTTKVDRAPRRSGRHLPFSDDANEDPPSGAPSYSKDDSKDAVDFSSSQRSSAQESAVEEKQRTSIVDRGITVGSVVIVQPRTWPGINKAGGVGRVTKVEYSGFCKKYDVAYVLGGKEKGIDEIYLSLNEAEQSESFGLSMGARVSRSADKAPRPSRKRNARAKKTERTSSIPVFNEEELQQIPTEVLEWAGIARPKKAGAKSTGSKASKPVHDKKRVLTESCGNVASMKSKNVKTSTKALATTQVQANDSLSFEDAIQKIANDDLMHRADERYSSLLAFDDEFVTLHAVTSSLSDGDTKLLASLIKTLKSNNVNLKIMKDFKAGKTQLCITPASLDSSNEHNTVSKSRTLKVMRSALLGLPILTPLWMEACINESQVLKPTSHMCIRSLPRKSTADDDHLASYGVAKYAAAVGQTNSKVLSNCSVLLCGKWKDSGQSIMKDLKILLDDAGATLIGTPSSASKLLTGKSSDKEPKGRIILLCDDSHTDADCGVSDGLCNAAKSAIAHDPSQVLAAHFQWLFDCVSCARFMPSSAYEPIAPRSKELWRLSCESNAEK